MDKNELILKTKQKIDEIKENISQLKEKANENKSQDLKKQSNKLIGELEEISEDIQKQYSSLGLPENQSDQKVTEIEKNIYNGIQSFDSAFSRAGSIFQTH